MIKSEPFIIIGLRRSGTSYLRELLSRSPQVNKILFEPWEIYYASILVKHPRYVSDKHSWDLINHCKKHGFNFKLAINPGIHDLDFVKTIEVFPEYKIIFLIRNPLETYTSYMECDKGLIRGIIGYDSYLPMYEEMVSRFNKINRELSGRSVIVDYDKFYDAESMRIEMDKIYNLIGIDKINGDVLTFNKR